MSYGQFESVEQVASLFDIKVRDAGITQTQAIEVPDALFSYLRRKLEDSLSFRNEATICNKIITPILNFIAENNEPLNVWIQEPFNVDQKKGLVGAPDYLIASANDYGGMAVPPLCVIEAKKQDWDDGWTQALAEMIAASLQGAECCFSVVTTGKVWQFGELRNGIFSKDPNQISATRELQLVLDSLNWMFAEINPQKTVG